MSIMVQLWPPPPRLDPKIAIFRGCAIFFRTTELQHKLLISVELPIFNWKSAKKTNKMDVVLYSMFSTDTISSLFGVFQ